jgi:phosphoglycerol transferase MdoB-like AlkP superfamily enzyme
LKILIRRYLKITLFYVIFFAFARLIFFLVNHPAAENYQSLEILQLLLAGLRLDISLTCYILLASMLFFIPWLWWPFKWLEKAERYMHFIVLGLISMGLVSNIIIFHFWNSILNFRALSYLSDPGEVFLSLSSGQILIIFLFLLTTIIFSIVVFKKWFYSPPEKVTTGSVQKIILLLTLLFCTLVGVRGGLQMLPVNESLVYFSEKNFLNQAAINPLWHLAYDIQTAGMERKNPFRITNGKNAEAEVKSLFQNVPDSFPRILTSERPNVVILILESFNADLIGALGGDKNVSPFIDQLAGEGMLFNSIYASGTRTDQGIVSVLNGWPATPFHSIMRSAEKSASLPSLPKIFLSNGYQTSFYYGGEINFSNMNVYCSGQKFNKITDEKDFRNNETRSRWGLPDEYVLHKQLNDLKETRQPFFSVLMTLSNHEPFDVPRFNKFPGKDPADRFRNSAAYTDSCLSTYFSLARKEQWFSNTLFILVADHGHSLPLNRNIAYPDSRRILCLLYGDVIRPEFRGSVVTKQGGHHDLPGTILPQLGHDAAEFRWSKNLLNPTVRPFAYFQVEQTFGMVDSALWFSYWFDTKKFVGTSARLSKNDREQMLFTGSCFLQELYKEYQEK